MASLGLRLGGQVASRLVSRSAAATNFVARRHFSEMPSLKPSAEHQHRHETLYATHTNICFSCGRQRNCNGSEKTMRYQRSVNKLRHTLGTTFNVSARNIQFCSSISFFG